MIYRAIKVVKFHDRFIHFQGRRSFNALLVKAPNRVLKSTKSDPK